MSNITYVGLDVHTTNYTACCYSMQDDQAFAIVQMEPDYKHILKYLNRVNSQHGGRLKFLCDYEVGCLGYSLYHELTSHVVDCVILVPSTMANTKGKQVKTDRRDAKNIAKCLAYRLYSPVYVPTEQDNAVKEYIRMRDDSVGALKRVKQQIIALCTRNGKRYGGKSYWTKKHEDWLLELELGNEILNETLREYLGKHLSCSIMLLCVIGAFAIKMTWQDIVCAVIFGFVGYGIKKFNFSNLGLILGLILDPIAETAFH